MPNDDPDPAAYLPLTPALFQVLLALADGGKHGYGILKEIEQRTNGRDVPSTGTLYGIIKRLLHDGLIRESPLGGTGRRRTSSLTPLGRKVALAEAARLKELIAAATLKKLFA